MRPSIALTAFAFLLASFYSALTYANTVNYEKLFEELQAKTNFVGLSVNRIKVDEFIEIKFIDDSPMVDAHLLFKSLGYQVTKQSEDVLKLDFDGKSILAELVEQKYVSMDYVSKLLWVQASYDKSNGQIRIQRGDKLPIMIERDRELNRGFAGGPDGRRFPLLTSGYSDKGNALFDVRGGLSYQFDMSELSEQFSLYSTQDFMYHEMEFGAFYSTQGDVRGKVLFSKRFNDSFIGSYEFGDVSLPGDNFLSYTGIGEGVLIKKRTGWSAANQFADRTIDGYGAPGNVVELYKNGGLIDWVRIDSSGRYRFDKIQMGLGTNGYKIREYGDYGEERERELDYYMSSSALKRGETDWNVGYTTGKTVFGVENFISEAEEISTLSMGYGITDNWDGYFGVYDYGGGENNYWLSTTARTGTYNLTSRAAFDQEGRNAFGVQGQSILGGLNVGFDTAFYEEDFSAQVNDKGRLQYKLDIFASGALNIPALPAVSYLLKYDKKENYVGIANDTWRASLSSNMKYVRGSVEFSGVKSELESTRMLISGVRKFRGATLSINYSNTLNQWRSWDARYSHNLDNGYLNIGLSGGVDTGTSANINFSKRFQALEFRAGVSMDEQGGGEVSLAFKYSAFKDRRDGRWNYSSNSYNGSTAYVRVFVDNNNNGVYDGFDKPVKGVKFRHQGGIDTFESNSKGWLVISNIPTNREVPIEIDKGSLPDAYMNPHTDGLIVKSHKGGEIFIDYPMTQMTDLSGDIHCLYTECNFVGLKIEIEQIGGDFKKSQFVNDDGTYMFYRIPPGAYRIYVNEEQMQYRGLELETEVFITMFGSENASIAKSLYLLQVSEPVDEGEQVAL